jgi:hypothetical protein
MENRSREKQKLPKSLLISFLEELERKNVNVKIREGDEIKIEWQLWKYKEILSQILTKASPQFKFKRFLLLFEKEGKVCWYAGELDRVAVNLYYKPESSKFKEAFQVANRLAQQLSPGIQEFQKLKR